MFLGETGNTCVTDKDMDLPWDDGTRVTRACGHPVAARRRMAFRQVPSGKLLMALLKIELTEHQRQALADHPAAERTEVVDPVSHREYVLIAREQYERVRSTIEAARPAAIEEEESGIPKGILRSQEAFWRDLPQLLTQRKLRGQWVCYRHDERIGIGTYESLIRECLRRGLADDEYYLAIIRSRELPPWEPEDVEPLGPHHLEAYPEQP